MFVKDIGIDLGTANTLVYMRGKGIVLREPSVVAVNTRTEKARYVGKDAKQVIGRTPGSIVAVRPLKEGVIADFDLTVTMLQEFIRKAMKGYMFTRARDNLHSVRCDTCGKKCCKRSHRKCRCPAGVYY